MTNRENYLRNVTFNYPERIPITIDANLSAQIKYGEEIDSIVSKFPKFFPSYVSLNNRINNSDLHATDTVECDAWGFRKHYKIQGIEGIPFDPPIDDWSKFDKFIAPNQDVQSDKGGIRNWQEEFTNIEKMKKNDEISVGGLVHGFLFLRLQYLRGFENLMIDMAQEQPKLFELIDIIDCENLKIIEKYCNANVDVMELPEDLGSENSMIISRDMFKKFILPSFHKMIKPCKRDNIKVLIHNDGNILDILEDMVELADILNVQDLCNGIDNLARTIKGRVCIKLDVDSIKITPNGTKKEIFELIEQEVKVLGKKEGGLELSYTIYPSMGIEQVAYICEAFQKYSTYWFDN